MSRLGPSIGGIVAGRYLIESRIAVGGMGIVFQALQTDMDRRVALKVLRGDASERIRSAEWFCREMRAAARIQHPNTVRVFDYGQTEDGALYLVMELLRGKTLEEELGACGRMDPRRIVHIGTQVAKALHASHSEGVIHRDLKADNVLLLDLYGERDFVKVVDFGIALIRGARPGSPPAEDVIAGTPEYMAPEQACDGRVDARADLYALGVLLYQMTVGRLPFTGESASSVLVQQLRDAPVPPSQVVPGGVPAPLESLILSLLTKQPNDRPEHAAAVVRQLAACGAHQAVNRRAGVRLGHPIPGFDLDVSGVDEPDDEPEVEALTASLRPRSRAWVVAALAAVVAGGLLAALVPEHGHDEVRRMALGASAGAGLLSAPAVAQGWGPAEAEVAPSAPAALAGNALAESRPVVAPSPPDVDVIALSDRVDVALPRYEQEPEDRRPPPQLDAPAQAAVAPPSAQPGDPQGGHLSEPGPRQVERRRRPRQQVAGPVSEVAGQAEVPRPAAQRSVEVNRWQPLGD